MLNRQSLDEVRGSGPGFPGIGRQGSVSLRSASRNRNARAEGSQHVHSDELSHHAGRRSSVVNSTGEKRIVGYALIDPRRGVAFGTREATEQALIDRWNASQATTEAEFRRELEANSESQLQDQAAYWLKSRQKFAAASPAALTAQLKAISSDATVQRLVDAGNLRVVARQADLPRHAAIPPGQRVAGWVDPDTGGVYLIAENITQDEVAGLLAHEIGVHQARLRLNQPKPAALRLAHTLVGLLGGRGLLGEPAFNDVLAQLERLRAAGNSRVVAAFAEAEAASQALNQDPSLVLEESLAYLVQHQPQLPLVQRFMAMVRAALYRMGFAIQLTDADLHALAMSAVRRAGAEPAFSSRKVAMQRAAQAPQDTEAARQYAEPRSWRGTPCQTAPKRPAG